MTASIALYEMTSAYPDLPQDMLAVPAVELDAAWQDGAVMSIIALTEELRLLRMIWSARPTMVHPTHVAALAREFGSVMQREGISDDARAELERGETLCAHAASNGDWIVSIGP